MGYTGGAAEPQPPTADVAKALDAALAFMVRPLEKEGLALHASIEPDLDVAMTPIALQQVLMNLLMNAREALDPKGTITVRGAREPSGFATITVSDDGPGIPDDLVPNLFEPFATASQRLDSHGLGLPACALLIGNANGRITVETAAGEGTRFTIELPLANQLRKTA
jgi:signal transduction histidine kinase